jgi:hypothetical protein
MLNTYNSSLLKEDALILPATTPSSCDILLFSFPLLLGKQKKHWSDNIDYISDEKQINTGTPFLAMM